MTKTYKLTLAGLKPSFEISQAYMVRTRCGDLWIRYIGESTSDEKPIFITDEITADDLVGASVYDSYSRQSRILFVTMVKVKGYEHMYVNASSGAVGAGKVQEQGISGAQREYKQRKSSKHDIKYSPYGKKQDEALQKFISRIKVGWWKIALSTVILWAVFFALTGGHVGLALGMPASFLVIATWPEISQWMKHEIKKK